MGYHFVNPVLASDARIDPTQPEILLHTKDAKGRFQLAGLEWFMADGDQDLSTDGDRPTDTVRKPVRWSDAGSRARHAEPLRSPRLGVREQPERRAQRLEPKGRLPIAGGLTNRKSAGMDHLGPSRLSRGHRFSGELPAHGHAVHEERDQIRSIATDPKYHYRPSANPPPRAACSCASLVRKRPS